MKIYNHEFLFATEVELYVGAKFVRHTIAEYTGGIGCVFTGFNNTTSFSILSVKSKHRVSFFKQFTL